MFESKILQKIASQLRFVLAKSGGPGPALVAAFWHFTWHLLGIGDVPPFGILALLPLWRSVPPSAAMGCNQIRREYHCHQ